MNLAHVPTWHIIRDTSVSPPLPTITITYEKGSSLVSLRGSSRVGTCGVRISHLVSLQDRRGGSTRENREINESMIAEKGGTHEPCRILNTSEASGRE